MSNLGVFSRGMLKESWEPLGKQHVDAPPFRTIITQVATKGKLRLQAGIRSVTFRSNLWMVTTESE
ncbi:MAG: hypothetical protein DDG58_05085 [Ardenticatenia bacterium]|nr:MAG: hypothetical protein DDG58_05085 [Ardenticatenia bacterium]